LTENSNILLFDGVCNLCNKAVQFVIKHDKKSLIKFASLQSDFGQKILLEHNLPLNYLNSFIYLKNNKHYLKSTAALYLLNDLGGGWQLFFCFMIVPKFIRDFVYSIVAKNRYKWFGKNNECMILNEDLQRRFIN
jgi:predicted DCC family thiol-disulfide oxidoreductase YuxK